MLRDALSQNADELQRIHDFLTTNCGHTDAFTGFLQVFKGQYSDAYSTATEGISTGVEGARQRMQAMAETLDSYVQSDDHIAGAMNTLAPRISAVDGEVAPPGGPTGLPGAVKHAGKGVSTAINLPGIAESYADNGLPNFFDQYKPPEHGTPASPLDVVDQGIQMTENFGDVGEASEDIHDYGDFLEENE
ncbi:hypothetical protein G7072_12295 [Nocardioides sp. HDW12B]|uniref:hypothetical protein n=1 Tax=Nocardioides sp. HDW12B TaxID=2714939 RepID=UPI00140ADEAA|nr:hypothetical protein [Nocardioides sp. HDW12B]QIK67019.1 hypothetical protein G7072_12295 [Nocardioides sp. HDW12B]